LLLLLLLLMLLMLLLMLLLLPSFRFFSSSSSSSFPSSFFVFFFYLFHFYLGRDDFFFFRLKKQQHLVSSATSTSVWLGTAMGVCEWPGVASSAPSSPFVDEITWTDPWRSAGLSAPPRRAAPPAPPEVQAGCRSRLGEMMTS